MSLILLGEIIDRGRRITVLSDPDIIENHGIGQGDNAALAVAAAHAIDAEVRLYDRLFTVPEPDSSGDFKSFVNPNSLEVVTAKCEPALAEARPEERYQFERLGYFALDPDSTREKQVWNRTVTLRDTWAKIK